MLKAVLESAEKSLTSSDEENDVTEGLPSINITSGSREKTDKGRHERRRSTFGRYQAHDPEDVAFKKIEIEELRSVVEPGGIVSAISRKSLGRRNSQLVDLVRQASMRDKQGSGSEGESSDDEYVIKEEDEEEEEPPPQKQQVSPLATAQKPPASSKSEQKDLLAPEGSASPRKLSPVQRKTSPKLSRKSQLSPRRDAESPSGQEAGAQDAEPSPDLGKFVLKALGAKVAPDEQQVDAKEEDIKKKLTSILGGASAGGAAGILGGASAGGAAGASAGGATADKVNLGMAMKLGKWKHKTAKTLGKTNKKHFAKNRHHLKLLETTNEKIAVELPLPLKIVMYEEFFPVIQQTVKSYSKYLGARHPLTKQAKQKVEEIARWGDVLVSL